MGLQITVMLYYIRENKYMKRTIIALTLLVMTFNSFALESTNMEDSLDDKTEEVETEEVEKGFDWLVIPEIDTTEPELPNNEYFNEKEKETVGFIFSLLDRVESLLQSPQN